MQTRRRFNLIPNLPEDPILGLAQLVRQDPREDKVDLSIGIYRNESGKSLPMAVVKEVESKIASQSKSKVYLPIEGDPVYLFETAKIVIGESLFETIQEKIVMAQAVGGTSALSTLARMFSQGVTKRVFISDPTWPNHLGIFQQAGFSVLSYPYYEIKTNRLCFDRLLETLDKNGKEDDLLLLHGCCHNPTGADLTEEQWKQLLHLVIKKKMIPLFDLAYQGFGISLEKDSEAIRLFIQEGIPLAIAVSHSKNFGLYADRIGAILLLTADSEEKKRVLGMIKSLIRTNYSNPPRQGSAIISEILTTPYLKSAWIEELTDYQKRIEKMRIEFMEAFIPFGLADSFEHLRKSSGMFCFTGLTQTEVEFLMKEKGIYMTKDGRINVTGLNASNLEKVVKSIAECKKR